MADVPTEINLTREEDREDMVRVKFIVHQCPLNEQCTHKSFKTAAVYCFTSAEDCQRLLEKHLVNSAHHYLTQENAERVASEAEIDVVEETFEEREAYRTQLEQMYSRLEKAGKGKSKKGGGGSAGGRARRTRSPSRHSDAPRSPLRKRVRRSRSPSLRPIGSGPRGNQDIVMVSKRESSSNRSCGGGGDPTVTIPLSKARVLIDTINRISYATKQIIHVTSKMNQQLGEEEIVLREAKAFMEAMVQTASS